MNLENHPKRGILKDIDKTTLLQMRESGMTNREISESIGCSLQTIYRIIGKQPKGMKADRRPKGVCQATEKPNLSGYKGRRLHPLVYVLQGQSCRFRIDSENGNVSIEPANGMPGFRLADLTNIVQDIIDLSNDPVVMEAAT